MPEQDTHYVECANDLKMAQEAIRMAIRKILDDPLCTHEISHMAAILDGLDDLVCALTDDDEDND